MRFAIGHMNFFDNDLIVEIVEADDFRQAIFMHSSFQSDDIVTWLMHLPENEEEIKEFFFNGDMLVGWVACQ